MKALTLVLLVATTYAAPSLHHFDFDLLPLATQNFPPIRVPSITGLYETPRSGPPPQQNPVQYVPETPSRVINEIPDGLEQIDLRNSPSQENEVISDLTAIVPSGLYETPHEQTIPIAEDNEIGSSADSFLLENIEQNVQRLNEIVQEPIIPSGLYETPLGTINTPLIVVPPVEIIPASPQEVFEVRTQPDPPTSSKKMLMPYDFNWGVNDAESTNNFRHVESSDGITTRGEYSVLLPDGRIQTVKFFDDGNGFNAEVTYT